MIYNYKDLLIKILSYFENKIFVTMKTVLEDKYIFLKMDKKTYSS